MLEKDFEALTNKITLEASEFHFSLEAVPDNFTHEQFGILLTKLLYHPNVSKLIVSGNITLSFRFTQFLKFVAIHSNLKSLILQHTKIGDPEVIYLTEALKYNKNLVYLDLRGNRLGKKSWQALHNLLTLQHSIGVLLMQIEPGEKTQEEIKLLDQLAGSLALNRSSIVVSDELNCEISLDKLDHWLTQTQTQGFIIKPFPELAAQEGSTCGYQGISTATAFFHAQNPDWSFHPVQPKDDGKSKVKPLFPIGKKAGFFRNGTIANYDEFQLIVNKTQYDSHVEAFNQHNLGAKLRAKLLLRIPVLLAVDFHPSHGVIQNKGASAHCIVLVGFFISHGRYNYVYVSSDHIHIVSERGLYNSISQLEKCPSTIYLKVNHTYWAYNEKLKEWLSKKPETNHQAYKMYTRPEVELTPLRNNFFVLYPRVTHQPGSSLQMAHSSSASNSEQKNTIRR